MGKTNIEWTDESWNPVRGCSRVSPGCGGGTPGGGGGCYAERQAIRHAGPGGHYEGLVKSTKAGPRWTGEVRPVPHMLAVPLGWREPRRCFVNSMSDLFHESLPNEYIAAVYAVMAATPQSVFQVLTKRAARMAEWFQWLGAESTRRGCAPVWVCHQYLREAAGEAVASLAHGRMNQASRAAPPFHNVWQGVSVENQETADDRIHYLLEVPAAVRFLSCEPLLGPVNLGLVRRDARMHVGAPPVWILRNALTGEVGTEDYKGSRVWGGNRTPRVNWVIIGGESGPKSRPFDLAWARALVAQCRAAGVPVFLKQLGAHPVLDGKPYRLEMMGGSFLAKLTDRKGGKLEEWPEDLRVREEPSWRAAS